MRIAIAADHAGYAFKERLERELIAAGHEVRDFGTDGAESCDYPDYGVPAARSVAEGACERAVLMCHNGIGMCMAANRIAGVKAALVYSKSTAAMTRRHHGSNVLCLGAGEFPAEDLLEWVRIWLSEPFDGGRHERRVSKILALDRR